MKKFAVVALVLGFTSLPCRTVLAGHIGLQGGVAISDFNSPSGVSSDSFTGWALGVAFDVPIGPNLSIAPEALFVRRGANVTDPFLGAVAAESRYSVLEIPVFVKIGFGDAIRPVLFAGPNFGFVLSHSVSGVTGTYNFDPNTFDFGLSFGGGVEAGPFFANLRYQVGFVELDDNSANWQSRGFLLLVGLKL